MLCYIPLPPCCGIRPGVIAGNMGWIRTGTTPGIRRLSAVWSVIMVAPKQVLRAGTAGVTVEEPAGFVDLKISS